MPMLLSSLLLAIPGPFDDLPGQGFAAIDQMHDKINTIAWSLFGLAALMGAVVVICGSIAQIQITWHDLVLRMVLVAMLLVGFRPIFYAIVGLGLEVSYSVMSKSDQQQVSHAINQSAGQSSSGTDTTLGWLSALATFILNFSLDPGKGVTGLVIALSGIFFLISLLFVGLLWLALVIILYVLGPIAISLGAVPRWGDRFTSAWFGSLVQLSLWPLWFAFVAWFIKNTAAFFIVSNSQTVNPFNMDQNAENLLSAVAGLLFGLLSFAGPLIIAFLFPISRTSQLGHYAYGVASSRFQSMVGGAASTATAVGTAGSSAGAGGGAAAGGGSATKVPSAVGAGAA